MILTKKQLYKLKMVFVGTFFAFTFNFALPHMSYAAYENYQAAANGEDPRYVYTLSGPEVYTPTNHVLDGRDEKLVSAQQFAESARRIGALPVIDDASPTITKEVWLTATAYSSTPDQTDGTPYTTAWMTPVRDGVVALNFLPKGSMVRFPDLYGDKVFIVEDRMNVRYTFRADIWMYTREEAKQFGLQYVRMEILDAQVPRDYVLANYEAAFPGLK